MENTTLDGRKSINLKIGIDVEIVEKQNQQSGEVTEGTVKRVLTKSLNHPHGIKVQLETGEIGRVKNIVSIVRKCW